jgi:pantetheine-phosphate adenylyltransferase
MSLKAIYPGTFDPVTNGHLDLIGRGITLFSHLTVAVAHNLEKKPLFSTQERVEMITEATAKMKNLTVTSFNGLLIDYAAGNGIGIIIRGLRAVSDFEHELQIGLINRRLSPSLETVFLIPSEKHAYLSSSIVKEVACFGGDIGKFVPEAVAARLVEKLSNQPPSRPI